jgi:hypothetical protein
MLLKKNTPYDWDDKTEFFCYFKETANDWTPTAISGLYETVHTNHWC